MQNYQPHVNRQEVLNLIKSSSVKTAEGKIVSELRSSPENDPYAIVVCHGPMDWSVLQGCDGVEVIRTQSRGHCADVVCAKWW